MDLLNDSDKPVRCSALHTLACDRCKEGACRPEEAQVLPMAMKLLASDPDAHVRAMSISWSGARSTATRLLSTLLLLRPELIQALRFARRPDGMRRGGSIHRQTKPGVSNVT